MSTNDGGVAHPQSMRQRRILDVAKEHPTASVADLASMVSSATPELVERVLDRHGDPCADGGTVAAAGSDSRSGGPSSSDTDTATLPGPTDATPDTEAADTAPESSAAASDTDPASDRYPTLDELSEAQREVLEAVAAQPTATQRELGAHFGLSGTTINNRVNSVPGFEWAEREAFVEALFDDHPATNRQSGDPTSTATTAAEPSDQPTDDESTTAISSLETAVDRLSERVAALEAAAPDTRSGLEDPELVHKIVHACMHSEAISESEELRILRALLQ